jgi:hypothetical protein
MMYAHSRSRGTIDDAIAAWNTRTPRLSSADADELMRLAEAWVSKRSIADAFGCDERADAEADAAIAAFAAKIKELRG